MLRWFLEQGVNVNQLSRDGKSALEMTQNENSKKLLKKWLKKKKNNTVQKKATVAKTEETEVTETPASSSAEL